jgi:hypothetical protein
MASDIYRVTEEIERRFEQQYAEKWHSVDVFVPDGYEVGIVMNACGNLQLGVRPPGEPWPFMGDPTDVMTICRPSPIWGQDGKACYSMPLNQKKFFEIGQEVLAEIGEPPND